MKSILVTGGNRGIGLEICRQMAKLEWQVYLGSRDENAGKKAAVKITGNITVVPLDVTDVNSIRQAFNAIPQLDVLINNAGLFGEKSLRDPDMEEIRKIMNVNFFGAVEVTKYFQIKLRKSSDPRIINVSSGMGSWADLHSDYAAYRLSKVSLNAFTMMLAKEHNGRIKVNAMCPGWVKTDMGGMNAPRSLEKGAETAVWLATEAEIPDGKFIRDKNVIEW